MKQTQLKHDVVSRRLGRNVATRNDIVGSDDEENREVKPVERVHERFQRAYVESQKTPLFQSVTSVSCWRFTSIALAAIQALPLTMRSR